MQIQSEEGTFNPKIERIANILRLVGWVSFWLELGLGAAASLMLIFAISGRNFSQALTPPTPGVGVSSYTQGTTPGLSFSIFWAVCGILALLFSLYLAFRLTRFARRLRNPNPDIHPKKAQVIQLLQIGVIAGLVGMLLFILGGGAGLGVLLSKSIAQPQGVAIYDPSRIIRSLDIFVAMANMTGIAAHFITTVSSLGLYNWLHRDS
ncbi:DUF3611 family protein [Brasilonema sp. UFV-L1]|uniref:DUF3611 family protein n=1 Tax=Brasilonema sp. UFV-L1 TaxID=2234130 RepID=UPI00145CAEDF|nr:DUF3611 family protein [Brasilonema sp. UFV-L1]NMG07599.1 hypothetical protein [Brasilonema sp. UFV-L1]